MLLWFLEKFCLPIVTRHILNFEDLGYWHLLNEGSLKNDGEVVVVAMAAKCWYKARKCQAKG